MPAQLQFALEYLRSGGWVMVPIGICSVAMWMFIVERVQAFRALGSGDVTVAEAVGAVSGGAALRPWCATSSPSVAAILTSTARSCGTAP